MQFNVEQLDNGIKRVTLEGRLDMKGTAAIEDNFMIQTATKKDPVMVDMAGVDFIASIGVRMLVSNAKALARRGGHMVLVNVTDNVRGVLNSAGIDAIVPIYDSVDEATQVLLDAVA